LAGGTLHLSDKSEERLKENSKRQPAVTGGYLSSKSGKSLSRYCEGWLQYFRLARMKTRLEKIEGWLRRRLKCYRLKQFKREIGIVRFLTSLGVKKTLSWRTALSRKDWWRLSNSLALNIGMNNHCFSEQGLYGLSENYKRLFCTPF
jgi:hypothetical protein